MSDLVERPDDNDPFNAGWNACCREAATEIARLEEENAKLRAAVKEWRDECFIERIARKELEDK